MPRLGSTLLRLAVVIAFLILAYRYFLSTSSSSSSSTSSSSSEENKLKGAIPQRPYVVKPKDPKDVAVLKILLPFESRRSIFEIFFALGKGNGGGSGGGRKEGEL